jgi:hypothetical protein
MDEEISAFVLSDDRTAELEALLSADGLVDVAHHAASEADNQNRIG